MLQTSTPLGFLNFGNRRTATLAELIYEIERYGLINRFTIPSPYDYIDLPGKRARHPGRYLKHLILENGREMSGWSYILAKRGGLSGGPKVRRYSGDCHFFFSDHRDAVWARLML
jgi:hypothetical protein